MHHGDKQEPTFGLDIQVFMDVIACGDAARRTSLALQIARFLADQATPAGEREQVLPTARRLAADPDIAVRRAFAETLQSLETLDADLLFTIVSDEDEVALPFLAATSALDSLRTLAVLRNALAEPRELPATVEQQVSRMDHIVQHQLGRAAASGAARFAPYLRLAPVAQRIRDSLAKVYADNTEKYRAIARAINLQPQ